MSDKQESLLQQIASQLKQSNQDQEIMGLRNLIAAQEVNISISRLVDSIKGMSAPVVQVPEVEVPGVEVPEVETIEPEEVKVNVEVPEKEEPELEAQEDPNSTPNWAQKMLDQSKDYYSKSLDYTNMLGDKIGGLGDKLANALGKIPGADAAKGFLDAIAGLAKTIFMTIGGFTAFNGFLDGMEKATEWFGEGAGFKELIASGIAGMLNAFGIAGEDGPQALAEKIVSVFNWMQEKIEWMFEGVKKVFGGISAFVSKTSDAISNFDTDPFGSIWEIIKSFATDVIGNLNVGAVAALAVIAPKFTMGLVSTFATTIVPKVIGMLSAVFGPAIASIGSTISAAIAPLLASLSAAAAPLAAAALPVVAIAAGLALVIKGVADGIQSALDVFEGTGSVVESLKAGLSTMIGTIIGFVPDLLKNIVSWAAEKLGFEGFSDKLDSFSFTDAITDAFRNVLNWFEMIPLKLKSGIYALLDSLPFTDFSDEIAANDAKLAELNDKHAKTATLIEDKRKENKEAELAKEEKKEEVVEQVAETPIPSQEVLKTQPATDPGLETRPVLTPDEIQSQSKPVVEGLGKVEQVMRQIRDNLSAEVTKKLDNATGGLVMTNNASVTNNKSTTAVSSNFRHNNIGATRGMFGSSYSPLGSP